MKSHYEKLREEQGVEAANAYMKSLRTKRKVYPKSGMNFKNPAVQKKAIESRERNRVLPEEELLQDPET